MVTGFVCNWALIKQAFWRERGYALRTLVSGKIYKNQYRFETLLKYKEDEDFIFARFIS
jgi:hypothetical protein